ncbi:major facilitator superfamily domain-containing protein [Bipolaris maydis]|nr:major facilitator superfamily domain-containing protein [Bipolaris maydis]
MALSSKRVAVIGAGISGVAAAAHLKKEGIDVTVFERSSAAGGIWLYDERKPLEPLYSTVPISKTGSTYASEDTEDAERRIHAPPGQVQIPCYVGLKNNVPTRLLETTLNKFPAGTEDIVSHSVLADYIQNTAIMTGVHEATQYDTNVKNVWKDGSSWLVETTTLQTDSAGVERWNTSTQKFDAVVVASGHYHAPRVPGTPGLAEWKKRWPDRVEHSKRYRKPENAENKNYLLVGGSVSATDIARELGPYAKKIIQSHRNGKFDLPAVMLPENAFQVDEVVSYDAPSADETKPLGSSEAIPGTVTLKSGEKICDIHHVILCTGYHITLPFLPQLHSDNTPVDKADDTLVVTDGTQFHNLHKDIFYINDPTLVFVGVPFFTATFTLFEFQAMAVAKVLSGQAKLPSQEAMRSEYNEKIKTKGYGKAFHSLRDQEEDYVNQLLAWINADLEKAGRDQLNGHSSQWHTARAEISAKTKELKNNTGILTRGCRPMCNLKDASLVPAMPTVRSDGEVTDKPHKWYYYLWDTLDKPKEERWFMFKLDAALLTFASLGYFIKYLDQMNINSAFVSGMKEDLGLYGNQLNYMQTCWTVGYVIGEIPSNIILTRVRPSIWIPAMELTWAVLTFCLCRAKNAETIYALRFLIGLAESTFYPGMQYIIGSWYRKEELAKRSCIFHTSGAIATMFSGYLMSGVYRLDGKGGFRGWQWLFIVDGIISIPIALMGFFFLPDLPEISKPFYLTKEEVKFAQERMQREGRQKRQPYTRAKMWKIFTSWHIYALVFLYIFFNNGNSGAQPVFQQFLKSSKHPKYTISQINTYPTATNAVQVVTTLLYAWTSDSILKGSRWQPIVFGGCVNIMCYVSLAIWDIPIKWKWACYILTGFGGGISGLCYAWAHEICTHDNEERAIVVASMNEMAYVVQAWLPLVVWKQVEQPRYHKGFITATCLSFMMIVTALTTRALQMRELGQRRKEQQEEVKLIDFMKTWAAGPLLTLLEPEGICSDNHVTIFFIQRP